MRVAIIPLNVAVTVNFLDANMNAVSSEIYGFLALTQGYIKFPADGVFMQVGGGSGGSLTQLQLIGSNRQLSGIRSGFLSSMPRVLTANGPFVSGTSYPLTAADGASNYTNFSGPVFASSRADSVGGQFGLQFCAESASTTESDALLEVGTATLATTTLIHPVTPVFWIFTSSATLAGGSVFLWLTPDVS